MKCSNGMLTFGSFYRGWSFQIYWPKISLEWARDNNTRNKLYPVGFFIRFNNVIRIVFNSKEDYYCVGVELFGFGLGIQYLKEIDYATKKI